MPEGKMTELEHYQLLARDMELKALAEKEARMLEVQKNAHLLLEVTGKELLALKSERANAFLNRSAVFSKIGERLEAVGEVGEVDSWQARMDHKNPENSVLIWPDEKKKE